MKNIILKTRRLIWKLKVENLEMNIVFKYALRPKEYYPLMNRVKFCKTIAIDHSLNRFSEQVHVLSEIYGSTIKLYQRK